MQCKTSPARHRLKALDAYMMLLKADECQSSIQCLAYIEDGLEHLFMVNERLLLTPLGELAKHLWMKLRNQRSDNMKLWISC